MVFVFTSILGVEARHGTFHQDGAFIVHLFFSGAFMVCSGEVEGCALLEMAFPGFYVFRNSLFNARSGCGGHKESMLMVFSSPYAFSSYYIAVGIFSYILGFVYPFFQHEVLFKEVLQFVCRVAEDVEVDSVFSFIEYPVGLVVGSQCGFVDFLDGTDGAFCFVEVCQ